MSTADYDGQLHGRTARPTLTNEELSVMRDRRRTLTGHSTIDCHMQDHRDVSLLIAALRAKNEQVDNLAEALRTCMKDLQEYGVIFAPGDPPYDQLLEYDEGC